MSVIVALILAVFGGTGNHVVTEPEPEPEPCPATVWSSWYSVPSCDLDGSQTWILSDESTDLFLDPVAVCADMGGVHAMAGPSPVTHYCIDVDY